MRKVKLKLKKPRYGVGMAGGMACVITGLFLGIPQFGGAGVVFTLLAAVATVFLGKEGFLVLREFNLDDEKLRGRLRRRSPEQKLATLQKLYEQKLISKKQFEEKSRKLQQPGPGGPGTEG